MYFRTETEPMTDGIKRHATGACSDAQHDVVRRLQTRFRSSSGGEGRPSNLTTIQSETEAFGLSTMPLPMVCATREV